MLRAASSGVSTCAISTLIRMANKGRATQLLVLGNKIDAAFSQDRTAAPGPGPETKSQPRPKFLLRDPATRHCAAKTRWLRWDGGNSLDCDALVIDEMSLVDVLCRCSADACGTQGDTARSGPAGGQGHRPMPSVGPGQVLADIIANGTLPVVRLTEVFRLMSTPDALHG